MGILLNAFLRIIPPFLSGILFITRRPPCGTWCCAVVLEKGTFHHRRSGRRTNRQTDRLYVVFPPKFRTRRRREFTTPLRRCLTTLFHATTRKTWRLILLDFHRRF